MPFVADLVRKVDAHVCSIVGQFQHADSNLLQGRHSTSPSERRRRGSGSPRQLQRIIGTPDKKHDVRVIVQKIGSKSICSLPSEYRQALVPAGQGARFLNLIIDYIAQFAISFAFGVVVVIFRGEEGVRFLENTPRIFIGIPILLAYYFACEVTTSRTMGKFVTGTKVVDQFGDPPSVGQVIVRTLCRLIPFEPFSCLGTPPRGWHDSIPKTLVVKTR